jgi:hypothetical protein
VTLITSLKYLSRPTELDIIYEAAVYVQSWKNGQCIKLQHISTYREVDVKYKAAVHTQRQRSGGSSGHASIDNWTVLMKLQYIYKFRKLDIIYKGGLYIQVYRTGHYTCSCNINSGLEDGTSCMRQFTNQ